MAVMGLFGRSKRHTKGNFEEKKDYEYTKSKKKKIRLNLLQHLTGENFHKTHNFYVLLAGSPKWIFLQIYQWYIIVS